MEKTKSFFLYPVTDEYSFDETCLSIIKELEKRSFCVPGIVVKFSNNFKYSWVSGIKGEKFNLEFYRYPSGYPNSQSHFAAVQNLFIPKNELNVYEDRSGPVFYHYVGKDWNGDKEHFFNSYKVNSKYNNEEKKYLVYSGAHHFVGDKAIVLVSNNDLHREYDPEGKERTEYSMREICWKFNNWLKKNVLMYIQSFPVS